MKNFQECSSSVMYIQLYVCVDTYVLHTTGSLFNCEHIHMNIRTYICSQLNRVLYRKKFGLLIYFLYYAFLLLCISYNYL